MDFPQSNPGVGGDQSSSEGSPAQSDAEQTALPFVSPEASGSPAPQDLVSRGHLDRITEKLKGAEARLAQYESQAAEPQRPGYKDEVERLSREAVKAFDNDPQRYLDLTKQINHLQAQATTHDALEGMLKQQQDQMALEQLQQGTVASWNQAIRDYPELQDQNSELYKSAFEIWSQDPVREKDPMAMYKAAAMANERRLRSGRQAPPTLEGGNAPTNVAETGDVSFKDVKADVIARMRRGDKSAFEQMLAPNMDTFLKSDHYRRGETSE